MSKAINPGMIVLPTIARSTPVIGVVLGYYVNASDFMQYLNARADAHDRSGCAGHIDLVIEYAHNPADIEQLKDIEHLTAAKPYIVRWSNGTVTCEAIADIALRRNNCFNDFWGNEELVRLIPKLWKDGQIEFLLPKVEHAAH